MIDIIFDSDGISAKSFFGKPFGLMKVFLIRLKAERTLGKRQQFLELLLVHLNANFLSFIRLELFVHSSILNHPCSSASIFCDSRNSVQ